LEKKMDWIEAKIVKRIIAGILALLLIIAVFSSYTVISPGYVGVLFNRVTGSMSSVPQGLAFKVPFVTTVQSYPVALRTYTMVRKGNEGSDKGDDSLDLPTLEGQHIKQDLSVTYNTSDAKAADVFRSFRGADIEDIENTFIRRTIITVAQNVSGGMPLSDVISSKRGDIQTAIQEKLGIELSKMGFTLDKVNMGASHLPESLESQMQQKMKAQQEAQQADYELQKQKTLAKAAVEKAHGEADSQLIQAEAQAKANALLQRSLTEELVKLKAIERWDGVLPKISSGAVPIIDLRGFDGLKK
jgi:regulator of protease activity HflC (stomatin/prohibitin superfamily)